MIKWGILGNAKIAREFLIPAMQNSKNGEFVALASENPTKNREYYQSFPRLRIHNSYDALLADREIDAIYIPLPNHLHVPWGVKALQAGKHVLIEKPMLMHAGEMKLLHDANIHHKIFCEAFMVCHHPQWLKVRALLQSGIIGKLRMVQGAFTYYLDDQNNIRNQADVGGGGIRDIGVYPLITTRFATGIEAKKVQCSIEFDPIGGTDCLSQTHVDFGDFTLQFYLSTRLQNRQQMTFHGDKGYINLTAPFNGRVFGNCCLELRTGNQTTNEEFNNHDQYQYLIESFGDAILHNKPLQPSWELSLGNEKIIDAMFESHHNKSWIAIN